MFIFYHLLPQVQLFFSRQVRVNLYLLGLITPHSFLQSYIHLFFLYSFRLPDFLQLFFKLFCDVSSGDDLCLLFDQVGNEGRVLFKEGLFQQDGFAAEDESDCSFFFRLEYWIFDDNAIPLFEFLSKIGIVAVYGSSAGGDGPLAWLWFEIDDFVLLDNFFLLLLFDFVLLTSLFRDIRRL